MIMLKYAYGNNIELPNFKKTNELSEKEFENFAGTYLEKDKNSTVTISSDSENMIFQNSLSGQMYVPFKYNGNNVFEYDGARLEFFPLNKEFRLIQGGVLKHYTKLSR